MEAYRRLCAERGVEPVSVVFVTRAWLEEEIARVRAAGDDPAPTLF
jgi:hypothetical protein